MNYNNKVNVFIGEKIKMIRESQGYSVDNLAEFLNINPDYINDLEKGELDISASLLWQLANGFDIDIEELFPIQAR